ncbi:MAG TPA: LytTR family DNA-binding domain-containing protein [Pyrinomonadaceae bacterium]|nr:LytTR family DNA-binding domain-containing protein [Pyrinomonadaceae bacterium]
MSIRTLIVDDEPIARDRVRRMLREESDIEIVGESGNGKEAVAFINENKPDLVFLDIQMPEMTGFEALQEINPNKTPAIIFVTAYDQYAIQAFDVHAIDYLLKPFNRERFKRAVERAREQVEKSTSGKIDQRLASLLADLTNSKKYLERLVVKSVGRVFFLRTDEVDWIEAAGNYAKLHVGREGHLIRETMNGLESKLNPDKFLRIHRSTLVNIDRIKELNPLFSGDYTVMLKNGTELTLSRNYRDRLLELFEKSS